MEAQYENLHHMIFDLNTSLDISWDPGEECIQYHGQDLTLNDISSQNEVWASLEKQQNDSRRRTTRHKLRKLCFDIWEKGL